MIPASSASAFVPISGDFSIPLEREDDEPSAALTPRQRLNELLSSLTEYGYSELNLYASTSPDAAACVRAFARLHGHRLTEITETTDSGRAYSLVEMRVSSNGGGAIVRVWSAK